jgi:hypothetical protein
MELRWPIIPIARDKKPPRGLRWKEFQQRVPTESETRKMFGRRGLTGLAVVLGELTGHYVADLAQLPQHEVHFY